MADWDQHNNTALLAAWKGGDTDALDRLTGLVYPELRRIARQHLAHRRAAESLESAALVSEAYLKLERAGGILCENRVHFLALCAQIMRRILVDHARRRGFAKRGGNALRLPLDEALDALARIDSRKSRVIELRYFGGLSIQETAEVLGASVDTVKRDWRMARAWLIAELASSVPASIPGLRSR
jgi:RNA polymerase sigma-70 factor (ECF subfamily)